jgi:hypothetical protein
MDLGLLHGDLIIVSPQLSSIHPKSCINCCILGVWSVLSLLFDGYASKIGVVLAQQFI